ncbi:MAG: pseudaminic acid cytidylyltransferase [Pseudomonadota bacterium]|nr:pseudaminic acid cytidylyltransferase [Pseudomonadota bacterium]
MERTDAICIIPARGGSRRVPGKNIRLFAGKPLIAHSIAAALASGCFARVIVSTDDEAIAAAARDFGAEIPFMRDAALADDHTGTAAVVADAVRRADATGSAFVCCLYPTAPLVRAGDLRDALARLREDGAQSLISVAEFDYPPLRALKVLADGRVAFNWPEHTMTRSQDLPQLVHDAGAFYLFTTETFLADPRMVSADTLAWPLERLRAVDIDTEEDFRFAEALMRFQSEVRDDG